MELDLGFQIFHLLCESRARVEAREAVYIRCHCNAQREQWLRPVVMLRAKGAT